MRDKDYNKRMVEMFALALAEALGIEITKKDIKDDLESKLRHFEELEEYEKCAEIRDEIKRVDLLNIK